MIDMDAILTCEWQISELKLRIAELQNGSDRGGGFLASSQVIMMLEDNLSAWEARKEDLVKGGRG
jgi:hypothetical protein